jgi:hypothetical protein
MIQRAATHSLRLLKSWRFSWTTRVRLWWWWIRARQTVLIRAIAV